MCDMDLIREELESKYAGKLQARMEGKSNEVFARVLRGMSGKKVIGPGTFHA